MIPKWIHSERTVSGFTISTTSIPSSLYRPEPPITPTRMGRPFHAGFGAVIDMSAQRMSKSDTVAWARLVWFPASLFPNNLPFRPTLSHPFFPSGLAGAHPRVVWRDPDKWRGHVQPDLKVNKRSVSNWLHDAHTRIIHTTHLTASWHQRRGQFGWRQH